MAVLNELEVAGGGAIGRLGRDAEAARDYARDSLSPVSRRAYRPTWTPSCGGAASAASRPLPAEPDIVDRKK